MTPPVARPLPHALPPPAAGSGRPGTAASAPPASAWRRAPRTLAAAALALAGAIAATLSGPAQAGPMADDLSRCLVRSTTPGDKSLLVQWMFAMMALHPDVSRLAQVPAEQRATLSRDVAGLFQRLLTRACNEQARVALQAEGPATFEASFNVLGQVAGRELFAHPDVAAGLADLTRHIDPAELQRALQARP